MQIRCCSCFEIYDDNYGLCPYCGYSPEDKLEEAYYLRPGTRLNKDRYIVGMKAGQGGFGITYKAWDTNLQRVVAIKEFFPLSMVTRGEEKKQVVVFSSKKEREYEIHLNKFRREAKIMSLFTNSKNCINTYDVFEENGTAYIVMEYFSAPTLKDVIKKKNGEPFEEEEAITIISQVLYGLEEIHEKGVYHLDIAPDNIFIPSNTEGLRVVIIYDFGAARLEKSSKRGIWEDEEIILKPGFAPPEQYKKNGKLGPWTDIYAVGATLYLLLTGTVPLEATDREHEDTLEEPAQLTIVSPAVNNAVLRAMALNPEIRYRSAKEFAEELKKEKVRNDKEELAHRKKLRRSFLAITFFVLVISVAAVAFVEIVRGKISEDEIIVWVISETDTDLERKRYQAAIEAFKEFYPQINVRLEVMSDSKELETHFLSAPKGDRPDLIETTNAGIEVIGKCISISSIISENKENLISVLADSIISKNKKSIPLGIYVTVIYKQEGISLENLDKAEAFQFLSTAEGYIESDTTIYSIVQKSIAGKYEVVESSKKKAYPADVFSIYFRSINKEKAAKALLGYFLTDAGQETLHIKYNSGYLPISEEAFDLYVEQVYHELNFLSDTISQYELE